jgi:hypothetical protein
MYLNVNDQKVTKEHDTTLVLEAAVAANRFNKGYVKDDITKYHKPDHQPTKWIVETASNKSLVYFLITNKLPSYGHHPQRYDYLENCKIEITMEDRCLARDIKAHYQGKLFQAMGGQLGEYVESIWKTLDTEKVSAREIGLICSTPSAYNRDLKNEKLEDSISGTCINEYIGSVGDKIEGQAEIINSFYAKNYESYVFTAIYDNKFLVNFWNKEEIGSIGDTFTIKARIKRLAKSKQYTGAWETQLNYVKKV